MIYFDSAATTLQKPAAVPAAVADAIHTMTTPGRGDQIGRAHVLTPVTGADIVCRILL